MALFLRDKKTAPSSRYVAADSVFTTLVPDGAWTNDRLGTDTPRGALGGMVAQISGGDYEVVIADKTSSTDFLFLNDAAGSAFENAPSVASGKIALLPLGNGDSVEVDVYETHTSGNVSILANYTINAPVYASARGLLTTETGAQIVGKVVKVPTTGSPRLGIKL
jgi:hypothetical protein